MRSLGRFLQFVGLALPPIAIVLEISRGFVRDGVADLLLAMVAAVSAFYLGRIIEGYAGPR